MMNSKNFFLEFRLLILKIISTIIRRIYYDQIPRYLVKLLTKVEYNIPSRNVITFKASKVLLKYVNNKTNDK